MRGRFLLGAALLALLAGTAPAASKGPVANKTIHVFVLVPASGYVSNITPEQAEQAVRQYLGSPSDPGCLGPSCSVNGYFRGQAGLVFDYDVTVHRSAADGDEIARDRDACGSFAGQGASSSAFSLLETELGYSVNNNRSSILLLGGGGWAGHSWNKQTKSGWAVVGDWGANAMFGVKLACDPFNVNQADPSLAPTDRGFAHEFEGMLGMFKGATGPEYDFYCCEKPLLPLHKRNLRTISGDWLRDP